MQSEFRKKESKNNGFSIKRGLNIFARARPHTPPPLLAPLQQTPASRCGVYGNWSNAATRAGRCVPARSARSRASVSGLQLTYTTRSNVRARSRQVASRFARGGSTKRVRSRSKTATSFVTPASGGGVPSCIPASISRLYGRTPAYASTKSSADSRATRTLWILLAARFQRASATRLGGHHPPEVAGERRREAAVAAVELAQVVVVRSAGGVGGPAQHLLAHPRVGLREGALHLIVMENLRRITRRVPPGRGDDGERLAHRVRPDHQLDPAGATHERHLPVPRLGQARGERPRGSGPVLPDRSVVRGGDQRVAVQRREEAHVVDPLPQLRRGPHGVQQGGHERPEPVGPHGVLRHLVRRADVAPLEHDVVRAPVLRAPYFEVRAHAEPRAGAPEHLRRREAGGDGPGARVPEASLQRRHLRAEEGSVVVGADAGDLRAGAGVRHYLGPAGGPVAAVSARQRRGRRTSGTAVFDNQPKVKSNNNKDAHPQIKIPSGFEASRAF